MTESIRNSNRWIIPAIVSILMLMTLAACFNREKIFTIGIVSSIPIHTPVVEGFKKGMAELGYVEGKNVRYVYDGMIQNDRKIIDAEIGKLLARNINLLLPIGNETALRAKELVKGTRLPILFSACNEIVEAWLVKSLDHPQENITGVINIDSTSKVFEWIKNIIPGMKKIYVPYNPDDDVSVISLQSVYKAVPRMGIEISEQKVHSMSEAVSTIKNMPKDYCAIFRIPSPTLDPGNSELSRVAMERGIPMVSRLPLDDDVLLTVSSDLYEVGRQTARLAQQIERGVAATDLPVETAELFLTVNLKTAEKIGLDIPDIVLLNANKIIR